MHESHASDLYIHVFSACVFACMTWCVGVIATYCVFLLLLQMSVTPYIGFADGACHSNQNLSSAAWVIYDPHGELVDL